MKKLILAIWVFLNTPIRELLFGKRVAKSVEPAKQETAGVAKPIRRVKTNRRMRRIPWNALSSAERNGIKKACKHAGFRQYEKHLG